MLKQEDYALQVHACKYAKRFNKQTSGVSTIGNNDIIKVVKPVLATWTSERRKKKEKEEKGTNSSPNA
jgi:hypothetical protein